MKEEKTKSKKRWLYYLVLAVCVLLLTAATVLTVYFVTDGGVSVEPPSLDVPSGGGEQNTPQTPSGDDEPDEPSGGETVRFVSPIEGAEYTVKYDEIYKNVTLGWIYRHKAADFKAEAGVQVRCMADGTVEEVSYSEETGNLIVVDHGDGLKTVYRFVEPAKGISSGKKIAKGDTLGTVAEAYGIERNDGTHLHLEIIVGENFVDPAGYLEGILDEK